MTSAPQDLAIEVAGESLVLLPERAAWWPARRTLLVADMHFGKSSVFRSHGLPVPGGTTLDNLARLDACLARCAAERIVFLGDLTHARSGHTSALLQKLVDWRARHSALHIDLIRGNHDRHAGVPEGFTVTLHERLLLEPPFSFCHECEDTGEGYPLSGHLHPAIVLSAHRDSVRVPCFVFGPDGGVLPAFGLFTGMLTMQPKADHRYFAVTEERVIGPIVFSV